VRTPHSSVFVRLASGAFYEIIMLIRSEKKASGLKP